MGQRRLAQAQSDDLSKRPNSAQPRKRSNIAVLNKTSTRKGEVFRAQRRTSENVNMRASQHMEESNLALLNGKSVHVAKVPN